MFHVSREINFCYGHRLLHYAGKCRHLHGHNGRAVVTFEAEGLDDRGMVRDFGEIKAVINRWIEENLDHRMILCRDDPAVPVLEGLGEPMHSDRGEPDGREHRQVDLRSLPSRGASGGGSVALGDPALPCHVSSAALTVPSPAGRGLG